MDNQILTAIIAAVSALSGAALSQVLTLLHGHLNRKHERRLLLRSKYEALVEHLNQSLEAGIQTLEYAGRSQISSDAHQHVHTADISARRVYSLCLLYFPLLLPHAEDYLTALLKFSSALRHPVDKDVLDAASKASHNARTALDRQIRECSSTYIDR